MARMLENISTKINVMKMKLSIRKLMKANQVIQIRN